MANDKELTVGLDVDTARARQKLKELAATGGDGGAAAGAAAEKAARGMDRAAASANALSASAREGAAGLRSVTRVFGGMAIRMATSYAAANMENGSSGRVAVDAAGSAIAGAIQGSIAGPLGALAGGVAGLAQSLMAASEEQNRLKEALYATNEANREQLESMLKVEERTEAFRKALEALNAIEDEAERKARMQEMLDAKKRELATNADELTGQSAKFDGNDKAFKEAMGERALLKGELSQLESLLGRSKADGGKEQREMHAALDSLSRLGGDFASGDPGGMERLAKTGEKTVAVLERIERKTGSGSGVF